MPANLLSVTVWADWTSLLHFVDGPPARSRLASLLGSRPWAVPLPSLDCCGQYSSENNCWERTLSLSRRDCSGGSAFASMSEETALFGDAAMCKRFQTLAQRKFEFRSYSSLFTAFHARRVGLLRSVQGAPHLRQPLAVVLLPAIVLLHNRFAVHTSSPDACPSDPPPPPGLNQSAPLTCAQCTTGPTLISLDSVSLLWYTCAVNGKLPISTQLQTPVK